MSKTEKKIFFVLCAEININDTLIKSSRLSSYRDLRYAFMIKKKKKNSFSTFLGLFSNFKTTMNSFTRKAHLYISITIVTYLFLFNLVKSTQ